MANIILTLSPKIINNVWGKRQGRDRKKGRTAVSELGRRAF